MFILSAVAFNENLTSINNIIHRKFLFDKAAYIIEVKEMF